MTTPRCYTIPQLLVVMQIPRRTFFTLRQTGQLPCLEEILPRAGRIPRYRADLVDRWMAGQWHRPAFGRRSA